MHGLSYGKVEIEFLCIDDLLHYTQTSPAPSPHILYDVIRFRMRFIWNNIIPSSLESC